MPSSALQPAIFALLACNAGIYASAGRGSEALDALAWFALLALFLVETRWPAVSALPRNARLLALLRAIAAAAVLWAAIAYLCEREWIDALNAWLWICVVAVLELEVRARGWAMRRRRLLLQLSWLLYAALAAMAVAWFVQGEWFDAWDGLLWIAAFALLETDLLSRRTAKL